MMDFGLFCVCVHTDPEKTVPAALPNAIAFPLKWVLPYPVNDPILLASFLLDVPYSGLFALVLYGVVGHMFRRHRRAATEVEQEIDKMTIREKSIR